MNSEQSTRNDTGSTAAAARVLCIECGSDETNTVHDIAYCTRCGASWPTADTTIGFTEGLPDHRHLTHTNEDNTMTTQQFEDLVDSLAQVSGDNDGLTCRDGSYIDWSTQDDDGCYVFEVGGPESSGAATVSRPISGDITALHVHRDDMRRLHIALTATLIRDLA